MKSFCVAVRAAMIVLCCLCHLVAKADSSPVVQRQFGKQTFTINVGEERTFYDFKQHQGWNDSYLNNSQSLTIFRPATAGAVIQITFEDFDVQSDGAGWPGYVNIYNGDPDADNSFAWETDVYGVTERPQMPSGNIIEVLDGKYTDKTLTSTASDGVLSVGMLWKRGKASKGWVAKVRCILPEQMTVKSGRSYYDNLDRYPRTKKEILLANISIETEGESNPDHLTSIDISYLVNENVHEPSTLRLYNAVQLTDGSPTLINSTVTQHGEGWRLTMDHTLNKGNNMFAIVGDLREDGTIGGQVSVDIVSVNTLHQPDGITPFDRETPLSVYCPGTVLMSEADTVIVGDYPLDFFDDGGLEKSPSKDFNGYVVFMPQDPNKKVNIHFNRVQLFPAPAYSSYGQWLKVYNGTDTTAANLLEQIRSDYDTEVRSSAENGALTVAFVSNVSTTRIGWEAKVSQIDAEDMTVKKTKVNQVVPDIVSPGDIQQNILNWNIETAHNGNSLHAQQFTFTTTGTTAPVTRATMFYTHAETDFKDAVMLGETTDINDTFTITLPTPQTLFEGDNWFWLAYDIDGSAVNGQRIDAGLLKMTLSGTEYDVEDGEPFGDRLVRHTVLSHRDQGTVTTIVNEEVVFKNRLYMETLDYYEWGKDDRINIFIPKHDDRVCQIDFSQFEMYALAEQQGINPVFRIYEGQGTDGRILWQYTHEQPQPLMPFTSTSADGALTIVFNPDASKFAETGQGFEAVVREFDIAAPSVNGNDAITQLGGSITLRATVKGGTKPYQIRWKNSLLEEVKQETTNQQNTQITIDTEACEDYYIYITDAAGKTAHDTCRVITKGEAVTATFEKLYLDPESYWRGYSKQGSFVNGTYLFENGYQPEFNYWHGFAYSNRTSTSFTKHTDQFNSAAGSGVNGSANYAVVYAQDGAVKVLNKEAETLNGFFVTNNAWVVNAILNGDGYTEGGFRKGDFVRLTAIGKHLDGTETRINYFLADYRADKEEDRYYLDTWQWFDLRPLGEVCEVSFEIGSTRGNLYGTTTPTYFCMDDFNGTRPQTDVYVNNIDGSLNVSQYFTLPHPTATISYTFADEQPEGITLTEEGQLDAGGKTEFTVVIKAVQRGQQQFIRLIVGNTTGITTIDNGQSTTDNDVWYGIDGTRHMNIQKGVNIIKKKDGTVKKVLSRP